MSLFDDLNIEKSNYIITQNQDIIKEINRTLHLLEPIFNIKNHFFNIEIDVYYLILLTLDRLVSDTFYGGTSRVEIIKMLKEEIINIYDLSSEESEIIAKEVLDGLNNSNNKQESFKTTYYDAKEKIIKKLDFRYIFYKGEEKDSNNYYKIVKSGFDILKLELERDQKLSIELKDYAITRLIDNENYDKATIEIKKNTNIIQMYLNLLSNEIRAIKRDIYSYNPNNVFLNEIDGIAQCLSKPKNELIELNSKIQNVLQDDEISNEKLKSLKILEENYDNYLRLRNNLSREIDKYFYTYNEKSMLKNNKISQQKILKVSDYPKVLELFLEFFDKNENFIDNFCIACSGLKKPKIFNPFDSIFQICNDLDNVVISEPKKEKNIQKREINDNYYSNEDLKKAQKYIDTNIDNEKDIVSLILKAKDDGLSDRIIKLVYLIAQDLYIDDNENYQILRIDNKFNEYIFSGDSFIIKKRNKKKEMV